MKRFKQQSFLAADGTPLDAQTEDQEFAQSIMLIYRSASIPHRAHPQSTSRLARDWADKIKNALHSREPDELLQDMQRFVEDPYWVERGCPLNAFFTKATYEKSVKSQPPFTDNEPKRETITASDFQRRKAALVESIIRASNSKNVEKHDKVVYAELLKEINSKECTLETIEAAEARF